MGLEPDTITVDCADPMKLAAFWAAAMGYQLTSGSDDRGAFVKDPTRRTRGMFFQRVPEPKTAKNRMHLDVRPSGSMAEEVERLKGLGATEREFIQSEGTSWTQMRDPEGNEFCVLRGPDDGWSRGEL